MKDTTFGPKGWTPDRLGSLKGKTYLITGTTAGAGFQATRILLSKGAKRFYLGHGGPLDAGGIERYAGKLAQAA